MIGNMKNKICSFNTVKNGAWTIMNALALSFMRVWYKELGLPPFLLVHFSMVEPEWSLTWNHPKHCVEQGKFYHSVIRALKMSYTHGKVPVVIVGGIRDLDNDDNCAHAISIIYSWTNDNTLRRHIIDTSAATHFIPSCKKSFVVFNNCLLKSQQSFIKWTATQNVSISLESDDCINNVQGAYGTCVSVSLGITLLILQNSQNQPLWFVSSTCKSLVIKQVASASSYVTQSALNVTKQLVNKFSSLVGYSQQDLLSITNPLYMYNHFLQESIGGFWEVMGSILYRHIYHPKFLLLEHQSKPFSMNRQRFTQNVVRAIEEGKHASFANLPIFKENLKQLKQSLEVFMIPSKVRMDLSSTFSEFLAQFYFQTIYHTKADLPNHFLYGLSTLVSKNSAISAMFKKYFQ